MYITWQSVVALASFAGALIVLIGYIRKLIKFIDHQSEQDASISAIKEELSVLTRGMLACLQGLQEQGCNGPVTHAAQEIEEHLNKQAHK